MRFIVFSICLFLVFASSLYALDQTELVLYLPFDEGSGVIAGDASGKGNNGELVGNVTWVDGIFGGAVYISDDAFRNYVIIKDNETLQTTGSMAIALWAKIEGEAVGSCCLLTKSNMYMVHTSDWSQAFPLNRVGQVEIEPIIWAGGTWRPWQSSVSVPVTLNEWHHIVCVYDGTKILNYIDGELKGEVEKSGDIPVAAADLVIGRDSRGWEGEAGIPEEGVEGLRKSLVMIDDVMIFNRAVSLEEVNEIKAGGVTVASVQPYGLLTGTWGGMKAEF